VTVLQPPGWPQPRGYANGMSGEGTLVFVSGQVGWDADGRFAATTLAEQVEQALRNVVAVLAEAGARPEHVVRLTWYLTDKRAYIDALDAVGAAYRRVMGRHYPTMSVVEVRALIEDAAQVEIEATAVIPPDRR
jgi:enamine deaminase RidA (YjgF/YER057c/UK114 family)